LDAARKDGRSTRDVDHALNLVVSRVLAVGLGVASALMLAGALLAAVGAGSVAPQALSLAEISAALWAGRPDGFLSLGILVLVVTPAARVVVLLGAFARRREWGFALVSAAVLGVLGIGLALGLAG
jgi:uncharacterized membrane protein